MEILPGDHFGKWTVLKESDKTDSSQSKYYTCKCQCGTVRDIPGYKLRTGRSKSCGCGRRIDMTGQKAGMLTFIEPLRKENGKVIWKCQCDCGNYCERTVAKAKQVGTCGKHRTEIARKTLSENTKKRKMVENTCIDSLQQKLSKNNKSGIKGVHWDKTKCKWVAQIMLKGKNYNLGSYDRKEVAAKVRAEAEKELFGKIIEKYDDKI